MRPQPAGLLASLALAPLALAPGAAGAAARPDAVVYGRVQLCGGPFPGRCFGEQMTVALRSGRRPVAAERTRTGHFHLRVPAGRYELVATTSGSGGLHWRRAVTAWAHRAVQLVITVPIP